MEHELADVGEEGGVADRKAVLGDRSEELAEDEVDIGGGEEIAANGGSDFRANLMRFEELLLGVCMEGAEGRVIAAEHAAAAAVGEGELTERGFDLRGDGVGVDGCGAFSGHESLWR